MYLPNHPTHASRHSPLNQHLPLNLMSQETLVSETGISDSPRPLTSWFTTTPPSGYEALPYEDVDSDSDEDSDVELWALKPAADIEASPVPRPFSTSTERNTAASAKRSPNSPRTNSRMRGVPKMFLILLTAGLPSTLFFSALAWLVGGIVLRSIFKVSPYDTMDSRAAFNASMAGAPIVALATGVLAFLDFALRRLPKLRASADGQGNTIEYDPIEDALSISSVCALACVLAMPLGFVMMPHLATETFGVWHGLGWSATGMGVPVGLILVGCLPQLLWCDTVDL